MRTLFAIAALVGLALLPVHACQDKPLAPNVKVTLVVILASEEGNDIDKSLKWVAAEIQKKNPSLTSFKLKSMTSRSLPPNVKSVFDLVEKQSASIVIKHGANSDNRVSLAVTAPNQGEIEYQTVCGKFLPIVTRYQTKEKERLILAVRVQPCQGD